LSVLLGWVFELTGCRSVWETSEWQASLSFSLHVRLLHFKECVWISSFSCSIVWGFCCLSSGRVMPCDLRAQCTPGLPVLWKSRWRAERQVQATQYFPQSRRHLSGCRAWKDCVPDPRDASTTMHFQYLSYWWKHATQCKSQDRFELGLITHIRSSKVIYNALCEQAISFSFPLFSVVVCQVTNLRVGLKKSIIRGWQID